MTEKQKQDTANNIVNALAYLRREALSSNLVQLSSFIENVLVLMNYEIQGGETSPEEIMDEDSRTAFMLISKVLEMDQETQTSFLETLGKIEEMEEEHGPIVVSAFKG